MSDNEIDQESEDTPPISRRGWSLNTPIKARKALARLIREFRKDSDPEKIPEFRALIYGLQSLLQFFKFEKDIEIEKDIEEIKKKLNMR